MSLELDINQIVLKDTDASKSVFVLRVPDADLHEHFYQRTHAMWEALWKAPGRNVPALLLISSKCELSSLTDDELRKVGLARITNE